MADISKIKLPDGNTYDVKDTSKSSATNWVNGSQDGSVRTVTSATEDSSYTIGSYAITEGYNTKASGYSAHAEGYNSVASGEFSHVEGRSATASGNYSHAQNLGTIASKYGQTAIGKYNVEDTGTANTGDYVLIIGRGSADNHRANAFAFTWDGDILMALETDIASGTDKEIYDALVALGWDADCIV